MRSETMKGERGQAIAFAAVVFMGMLAMAAFAVDTGIFLETRRELQNAADGAALAGAPFMPDDPAGAEAAAASFADANLAGVAARLCGTTPTYTITRGTRAVPGGEIYTISVSPSCQANYTVGRVLGLTTATIGVVAEAARGSAGASNCMLPFGVEEDAFTGFGDLVTLKVGDSFGGNYHVVDMTALGGGAAEYRAWLAGCDSDPRGRWGDVSPIESSEPGKMAGPTEQGLLDRGFVEGDHDPYDLVCPDSIGDIAPDGLVERPSRCLGVAPLVTSWEEAKGRQKMQIQHFALFFLEGYDRDPPLQLVTGRFVRGAVLSEIAAYDPYGTVVIRLTR